MIISFEKSGVGDLFDTETNGVFLCGSQTARFLGLKDWTKLPGIVTFHVTTKNSKKAGSKQVYFYREFHAGKCFAAWGKGAANQPGTWVNKEVAIVAGKVAGVTVNFAAPFKFSVWVRPVKPSK